MRGIINSNEKLEIKIKFKDSKSNELIRMADFAANTLFRELKKEKHNEGIEIFSSFFVLKEVPNKKRK